MLQLGVDPSNSSISHRTVIKNVEAWARNNNRDDESDPLQFDLAVLVRRLVNSAWPIIQVQATAKQNFSTTIGMSPVEIHPRIY